MNKKHFIEIANILSKYKISDKMVTDFIILFKKENNLFDEFKFRNYINENSRS